MNLILVNMNIGVQAANRGNFDFSYRAINWLHGYAAAHEQAAEESGQPLSEAGKSAQGAIIAIHKAMRQYRASNPL